MPDFVLNCAGTTRTTGTAGYLITGSTGKNRSMLTTLADGQQVAYHAEYKSAKSGFEDGIGTWNTSTSTLERTTISASSNADAAVSWGVGEKIVLCSANVDMLTNAQYLVAGTIPAARVPAGTTAGTFAVGNDSRFTTIDFENIDPADELTGAEQLLIVQDGLAVKSTAATVAGNPAIAQLGHAKNVNKSFSNFSKLGKLFTAADGSVGVQADLEPFLCYATGTGSGVGNLQLLFNYPALNLATGATSTGTACAEHIEYPILFNPAAKNLYFSVYFDFFHIPTAVNDFTFQVGFMDSVPLAADFGVGRGMFFELSYANANIQAVARSNLAGAPNNRSVDTGIPAVVLQRMVLTVQFNAHPTDAAQQLWKYYINGDLVATIAHNPMDGLVAALPTFTKLSMAAVIKKTAGTTGATLPMLSHYSEIGTYDSPAGLLP